MFVLKKSGAADGDKSDVAWKAALMLAYFGTLRGIYIAVNHYYLKET
jgi:hypothetical protein